jgi:hypothetical protein
MSTQCVLVACVAVLLAGRTTFEHHFSANRR